MNKLRCFVTVLAVGIFTTLVALVGSAQLAWAQLPDRSQLPPGLDRPERGIP